MSRKNFGAFLCYAGQSCMADGRRRFAPGKTTADIFTFSGWIKGRAGALLCPALFALCGQNAFAAEAGSGVYMNLCCEDTAVMDVGIAAGVNFGTFHASNQERTIRLNCDNEYYNSDAVLGAEQIGGSASCGLVLVGTPRGPVVYTAELSATQLSDRDNNVIGAPALSGDPSGSLSYDYAKVPSENGPFLLFRAHHHHIGGTLTIPAGLPAGNYRGTYTFTTVIQ